MLTPQETVESFLRMWGEGIDQLYASLHRYMSPDCIWENVGLSRTVGPAEAEAAFHLFEPMKTCQRIDVEFLVTATTGNTVLGERIDRVIDHEGKVTITVRVAGVFDVCDGKIVAWRDYFDTLPFAGQGPGQ